VRSNSTGEGKVLEEASQPLFVLALVGIDLGIDALQITVRKNSWCTVTWARDEDGVEIIFLDQAVLLMCLACVPSSSSSSTHTM
jgi:hypothetical protein